MASPIASPENYEAMWESGNWSFFIDLDSYSLSGHSDNERLALMLAGAALQIKNRAEARQLLNKAHALVDAPFKLHTILLASNQIQLGKAAYMAGKQAQSLIHFQEAWTNSGQLISPLFYHFLCDAAERQLKLGETRAAIQTWQDIAAIMQEHTPEHVYHRMSHCYIVNHQGFGGSPEENRLWGDCHKHDVLEYCHQLLQPEFYFEVGVDEGLSLVHAKGKALGVDARPELNLKVDLPAQAQIIGLSSDAFFRDRAHEALVAAPDLAFIDGMHLFEFALRDFINLERYSSPYTLVAIDDIYPCHPVQAERRRRSGAWAGDVWKLLFVLQKYRPDLILIPLNSYTTGLLLIAGLDATNKELEKHYEEILRDYQVDMPVPDSILERQGCIASDHPLLSLFLTQLRSAKESSDNRGQVIEKLQSINPLSQKFVQLSEAVSRPKTMNLLAMEKAYTESQQFTVQLFIPQGNEPSYTEKASIKENLKVGQWQEVTFSFTSSSMNTPIRLDPSAQPGLIEVASIRLTDIGSGRDVLSLTTPEKLATVKVGGDTFKVENSEHFLAYSYASDPIFYLPDFYVGEKNMKLTIVLRLVTNSAELRYLWQGHAG